jgi:hypothetical protein
MRNIADSRSRQIDSILFKTEACYPAAEFDPASIDVWHEALAEFDIEEISTAFSTHVKESKFLPTISEIIHIIKSTKGPQTSIDARAQQQWRVVMDAVRRYGYRRGAPLFADPITANLIRTQFRWTYLCEIQEQDENWEQKRWCEAFELAEEVHPDMKQIEVSPQVGKLADNVAKPVTEAPPQGDGVSVEAIRKYRQKLRGQSSKPQDNRETRVALLKKQAQQIQEEEIEKNGRKSVEQSNE